MLVGLSACIGALAAGAIPAVSAEADVVLLGGGASSAMVDDTAAAVSYQGQWSTSSGAVKFGGTDHYSDKAGASVTFAFSGTSVGILGAKAPHHGYFSVSIDGAQPSRVSAYSASRNDNAVLTTISGLAPGAHSLKISVEGNSATGTVAIDSFQVGQVADASRADTSGKFVTRSGNKLMLNGKPFRFAGTNEYYLGLDDNIRDASGNPTYPSKSLIDNALTSALRTGATVVRSHTIGISVGCAQCIQPSPGVFNAAAFASADYAVYRAGQLGLKLMVPLVDQWRWYHGGISTFTAWAGYANDPTAGANAANSSTQRRAEANFYTDPKVVASFKAYVSYVLNHVNPYTGVAYKNDPTIMAWETGNELWTAPPAWTQDIAAYLKYTVGAKQLIADGSAAHGMSVSNAAITAKDIDIVGGHFYPIDLNWLKADAAIAAANNKAYIIGEFDWTDAAATAALLAAVQQNPNISGDLYWALIPRLTNGQPVLHEDGFQMYWPAVNSASAAIQSKLIAHAWWMSAQ